MKMNFQRTRDLSRFSNYSKFRYETLDSLLTGELKTGLHTLHNNNRFFDFIFEERGGKNLFVSFGAAAGTDKPTYPIFSGKLISQLGDSDWLAFSDSGQSAPENLKTTWHLGTRRMPTHQIIPQLINRMLATKKYTSVVLFGSSAGGFAALNFSRQVPGSIAVVMNPRTELKTSPTTYSDFVSSGFNNDEKLIANQTSMSDAYSTPNGNRVIYLQNLQDANYYENHFLRFISRNVNVIKKITGHWGKGHVVPPKWVYESVLSVIFKGSRSIDEFFDLAVEVDGGPTASKVLQLSKHVIGAPFKARQNDAQIANQLLAGKLELSGRPLYTFSSEIDWNADPFNDNNWKFNLHSLRWTDPLRRTYMETHDERYLDFYHQIIRSWFDFHIVQKKHTPYSWYDMAAGSRVKVLAAAMQILPADEWLEQILFRHGMHLSDDKFQLRKGNHTLHAMIGLLIVGDYFQREDWTNRARSKISSLFNECVDPSGVDYEGALQYQINNYNWYSEARDHIIAVTKEAPAFNDRLLAMPDFLAHATNTAGFYVQYGESDRMKASNSLGNTHLEWAGSRGQSGEPPAANYVNYKAGYSFGRTGWLEDDFQDGIFYSLRYGPDFTSTPHGQRDAGAITLTRGDDEFLFESGRFRYDGSRETEFLTSAYAHTTVGSSNLSASDQISSKCIQAVTDPDYDWTVITKEIEPGKIWFRSVLHLREQKSLLVIDDLHSENVSNLDQYWQFSSDAELHIDKKTVYSASDSQKYTLVLKWLSSESPNFAIFKGNTEPMMGWRSTKHGEIFPATALSATVSGHSIRSIVGISFKNKHESVKNPSEECIFYVDNSSSQKLGNLSWDCVSAKQGSDVVDIFIPAASQLRERIPKINVR